MEPLLKNLQGNPLIQSVESRTLNVVFPKAFGYADDINSLTKNDITSLSEVFHEYEPVRVQRLME